MVFAKRAGVINGDPVPMLVPPVETEYQVNVPPPEAVKLAVLPLQIETLEAVGAAGAALTVTNTAVLVDVHPFATLST